MRSTLEANWNAVQKGIREVCASADRDARDVSLVAVTKHVSCDVAAALARLGQQDLGENRVDELERKAEHFRANDLQARWHFIGHLQRNKARRAVRLAEVIHSIDTRRLLESVDAHAADLGRRPGLYLEVKLTDEHEKHGFLPSEVGAAARQARELDHIELLGLMTMGPRMKGADQGAKRQEARATFDRLAGLASELEAENDTQSAFSNGRVKLSMGMSSDVGEAVAAGAHVVRVGSALFAGLSPEAGS